MTCIEYLLLTVTLLDTGNTVVRKTNRKCNKINKTKKIIKSTVGKMWD